MWICQRPCIWSCTPAHCIKTKSFLNSDSQSTNQEFRVWIPDTPYLTCSGLYWLTTELQGGNLFEVANKPFSFLRAPSSSITLLWQCIITTFSSQRFLVPQSPFLFLPRVLQPSLRSGMAQMMMKYSADRTRGRIYNQHRTDQIDWRTSYTISFQVFILGYDTQCLSAYWVSLTNWKTQIQETKSWSISKILFWLRLKLDKGAVPKSGRLRRLVLWPCLGWPAICRPNIAAT